MDIPVISRLFFHKAYIRTTDCFLDLTTPFLLYLSFGLVFRQGATVAPCYNIPLLQDVLDELLVPHVLLDESPPGFSCNGEMRWASVPLTGALLLYT